MPTEHGILMNDAMALATYEGRKWQTRRPVKPQPKGRVCWMKAAGKLSFYEDWNGKSGVQLPCKWQLGDVLWVRECWRPTIAHSCIDVCDCDSVNVDYRAGGECQHFYGGDIPAEWLMPKAARRGFLPSIHMPRWAARSVMPITDIRVERVQDISEADAIAEGFAVSFDHCICPACGHIDTDEQNGDGHWEQGTSRHDGEPGWSCWLLRCSRCGKENDMRYATAKEQFHATWNRLYPGGVERNDWTWALEWAPRTPNAR